MKTLYSTILFAASILVSCNTSPVTVGGDSELITFVGRTDHSEASAPKQWAAGGYFTFGFEGDECEIVINDECPYGETRNIIEIIVDDNYIAHFRSDNDKDDEGKTITRDSLQYHIILRNAVMSSADNTLPANTIECPIDPKCTTHHVTICRDSETAMGYTQLVSVKADNIFRWAPGEGLKIEFIGNSITCGAEADTLLRPRDQYKWGDWHRAYLGYGPRTARALDAQWSLVSVSGIGLIHSCCDMGITMPQVYDKIILRDNKLAYDFSFQPDIICSCLGQNDGIQDSTAFCSAYVDFIKDVKVKNPQAKQIVLLSSPMDHGDLNTWLCRMIESVVAQLKAEGIDNVSYFFYSKAWNAGGADHPSTAEHEEIAAELTAYLKTVL